MHLLHVWRPGKKSLMRLELLDEIRTAPCSSSVRRTRLPASLGSWKNGKKISITRIVCFGGNSLNFAAVFLTKRERLSALVMKKVQKSSWNQLELMREYISKVLPSAANLVCIAQKNGNQISCFSTKWIVCIMVLEQEGMRNEILPFYPEKQRREKKIKMRGNSTCSRNFKRLLESFHSYLLVVRKLWRNEEQSGEWKF